jgi:spermidine/putrescine-binding protein
VKARVVPCLLAALAVSACDRGQGSADAGELNVYIWSEYLPQEVVDEFAARTGVEVNVDLYDSNEAVLAKLQSGVAGYDLVVPTDYMVEILIAEELVQELDHDRLPNLRNVDPRFLDKTFDPGNRHSVPYMWGTTGLGYDRRSTGGPIDSWAAVFDPRFEGRILMLDDMREVFAVALKSMGHSLNATDPTVLEQAAAKLKGQKRLVRTYDSGDFENVLAAGDVDLAHGYNGQFAKVVADAPERLAYVVPKEGATLWIDGICIPTGARNVANAYRFLDYVLEPEVAARIVNGISYASTNAAARPFIDPRILGDPAVYPPDDVVANCELIEDIGEATTLMDRYWTEIKAQ